MTHPCYHNNSMSLVERKKQQWAREREELERLGILRNPQYQISFDKTSEKYSYSSKPTLLAKEPPPDYQTSTRRSSLPPLYKNQFNSNYDYRNDSKPEKPDRGGETSGYGSDSFPTPEYKNARSLPHASNNQWSAGQNHQQSGYESSSSCRDDRAKWGDKGVGIGKFWQAKDHPEEKSPNEPPNWVKRGLEAEGAIVVANSSPSVSPEQNRFEENDRPCTGSSFSHPSRSYIRGQNIPIDAAELAERERKRQMALAHQEAIRQQLEEREKKRQEERARIIREEHEEELRIQREQEHEKQRKLEEERALQEKLERERKRKEAIQQAMEKAEQEAKLEKMRLRMMKHQNHNLNIAENVIDKDKVGSPEVEQEEQQLNNTKEVSSAQRTPVPINKEINNNLTAVAPQIDQSNDRSLTPLNQSPRHQPDNLQHQFNYFIQPTMDSFQAVQYALLIPTTMPQYPVCMPVSMPGPSNENYMMLNTTRTENRVLTPTQYRNNMRKCDSSTQTDMVPQNSAKSQESGEKFLREKMSNLELSYENKRRERRSRSESMEERPKWGVNRPPTRYMKQSEKDLLYQRRKLRQKRDANKSYDEKNSSDDSQIGTPIRYRRKDLSEKRHSRARWRKEERRIFSGNIQMYQTEIVPIDNCGCRCHGCTENSRVDILKIQETSREGYQSEDLSTRDQKDEVLNKLQSLQNGLMLAQEKWDYTTSPH